MNSQTDETVPGQVDIKARLDAGDARMTRIEAKLEANTAVTTDIKDILKAPGQALALGHAREVPNQVRPTN